MEQFTHALIVIAIITAIFFAGYKIFLNPGSSAKSEQGKEGDNAAPPSPQPPQPSDSLPSTPSVRVQEYMGNGDETVMFAEWSVSELDRNTGKPISTANINVLPGGTFTIGRSKDCDFPLKQADVNPPVVGRCHLKVGKDSQGYFAKDNGSVNGTYINDINVTESFGLQDGQVIWLADCPIVFIHRTMDRNISSSDNKSFPVDSLNATRKFSSQDIDEQASDMGFQR